MENVVKQMLESGLSLELLFDLAIIILVITIVMWLKGAITRYLAFSKFKGSMDISKDVIVRMATPTGYVDYRLISVDRSSIILVSLDSELKLIVPTKTANDRDWVLVRRKDIPDDVSGEDAVVKKKK